MILAPPHTRPLPHTSLPDPSSFLPLPLGFGRVCPFQTASFLEMFVKTFLRARPIKKAWRYVCLGVCVCVCVCVFVRVWVCTCALWLGCRVQIAPKQIKRLVQALFAMPTPPPPLVVCCVGMWRPGLWCVGLWCVGMWFLGLWCVGL